MRTARQLIIFLVILFVFAGILSSFSLGGPKPKTVDRGTFVAQINEGKIKSIDIRGNELLITLQDGSSERATKEEQESLGELLKNYEVNAEKIKAVAIEVKAPSGFAAILGSFGPAIVSFLLIIGVFYFMFRQVQGANTRAMSFGQSGAREYAKDNKKDRVSFKDVAGAKESKDELQEIVEFLRNPKKFALLGAKIPKGVLLMGNPGTGKTLLARAVAGEANVPFFHISGSEFVEMFVGVGAARVRDLFTRAKKSAPCIVFIDEIDAVGRQRGAGLGGSHDEREQTLNQILVEMDGFDPNAGIIVIAATNRPDILDPALLRPGRFDRRVVLDLPDINDRLEILKIHAKNKPLAADVDMRQIAERTPGFSGADLANLLNEGAILAARRNKKTVAQEELLESVEKVMLGPERRSRVFTEEERRITAWHEGGHALAAHELKHADPVRKISIISRGHAAGYTLKLPTEDKHFRSRAEFVDDLAVALGGFVAEREVFGDVTTGASNDLKSATKLARTLVTRYGMSAKLGPRTFGEHEELIFLGREISEQRDYSEKMAELIDEEVSGLIINAMKTAEGIIRRRRDKLDELANRLLKQETMEQDEFEALFESHPHAWKAQPKAAHPASAPSGRPSRGRSAPLSKPKPATA